MTTYLSGFALGLGLIVAIGAQNAFVLRQGLIGKHVFAVCALCAASDALLIALGVAGVGLFVAAWPWALDALRYLGVVFLAVYGALRLRAFLWPPEIPVLGAAAQAGLAATLGIAVMFTWANPHVWLDTVVLVGGLAQQRGPEAWVFGAGAITASFVFFFALGYGAAWLRPVFASRRAWRVLDLAMAGVMFTLAWKLYSGGFTA